MICNLPWYPLTPSVYYTGLSYYEDLCKIAGYINDIVETLESYDYEGIQNDIATIKKQQTAINKQIESLQSNVNNVMKNVNNALNCTIHRLQVS